MNELYIFSISFFAVIIFVTCLIHVMRTSPYSGHFASSWQNWMAEQIQSRWGVERESFLARLAKLAALVVKYGVAGWTLRHADNLSLLFWVLFWVVLLVLEVMKKTAQFYIPTKWESVSLKLDSEHFWLIHLVLLGSAELQIVSSRPWGIMSLTVFYVMFAGESKPSILSALDDVTSCCWALIAICFFAGFPLTDFQTFVILLSALVSLRGIVRLFTGRAWLRRRFWWVAQFCLMTSLIIKSLAVLNVWNAINS
jgi:hypothetical protein